MNKQNISERIKLYPGLHERIEALLDVVDNKSGDLITIDNAEDEIVKEFDKLGKELLQEWANVRQEKAIEVTKITHPSAKRHEKKNFIGKLPLVK